MKRSNAIRQQHDSGVFRRYWWKLALAFPAVILLGWLVYRLPPVYSRLSWRIDELQTRIKYALNPPEEAIFLPSEQNEIALIVQMTLAALTPTPAPSQTPDPLGNETNNPAATPTIAGTPLPDYVFLDGVKYVDQHNRWNYCGPANLSMALNFWGWAGNRDDVARVIKPGVQDDSLDFIQRGRKDKNVMPYEMADFVTDNTQFSVLVRSGGDIELIKKLIASGFPVVIEKGYYEADYTGKVGWLGHYLFVTGYDDGRGAFNVQDAYLEPGNNIESDYDTFIDGWRSFNYLFMVVYPPENEDQVLELLGNWSDPVWANQHALENAQYEASQLKGINEFFAWFNIGTSQVALQDYADASFSYDFAFLLYSQLEDDDTQRPYRIMWYQTGPYWAYYYSQRYQDTISLADNTLYETVAEPTLEESLYWRGMARLAIGETDGAVADFHQTVYLNPSFTPGIDMLNQLGVTLP